MFSYFYHGTTRSYISIFGSLFNNITVRRSDAKTILVPISFGNKEKFIAKIKSDLFKDKTGLPITDDPNSMNVEVETILPRIGYSMVNLTYDPIRKTNLHNKIRYVKTDNTTGYIKNSVPYNLFFDLEIFARYEDDMLQIVEQIIPFFQPHFNLTVKDLTINGDIVAERDISIDLETVQPEEDFEGDGGERRVLRWTLSFVLKGNYYPAISNNIKEIKQLINNIYNEEVIVKDVAQLSNYLKDESVQWDVVPTTAVEETPHDKVSTWTNP